MSDIIVFQNNYMYFRSTMKEKERKGLQLGSLEATLSPFVVNVILSLNPKDSSKGVLKLISNSIT
jgi:hypothetical protein